MTTSQAQKIATVGQVLLGGFILVLQVAGLIRNRSVKTDVGSAAT